MISYSLPDCSGTFLNSIYKTKFEIILPFKMLNLLCCKFNLYYLVAFSVGFRLSVHLELTSKSEYQKLLKDLR